MSVAPGSVLVPTVTDTAVHQEPHVATACFRWGFSAMRCAVCVNLHQASKTIQEKESRNLIQVFYIDYMLNNVLDNVRLSKIHY